MEPWQFVLFILSILGFVLPTARIIQRTGKSRWWILLIILPGGIFVALWVVALSRWPALERGR